MDPAPAFPIVMTLEAEGTALNTIAAAMAGVAPVRSRTSSPG